MLFYYIESKMKYVKVLYIYRIMAHKLIHLSLNIRKFEKSDTLSQSKYVFNKKNTKKVS